MKHTFAVLTLGLFVMMAATTAYAQPLKKYETNWLETIIQTLIGTQQQSEIPVISHHHRKFRTHGKIHRSCHLKTKCHVKISGGANIILHPVSAGATISPAHTKLFHEFEEWQKKQKYEELRRLE